MGMVAVTLPTLSLPTISHPFPFSPSPPLSLVLRGWKRPLLFNDLTDINDDDKTKYVGPRFQRKWDKQLNKAG